MHRILFIWFLCNGILWTSWLGYDHSSLGRHRRTEPSFDEQRLRQLHYVSNDRYWIVKSIYAHQMYPQKSRNEAHFHVWSLRTFICQYLFGFKIDRWHLYYLAFMAMQCQSYSIQHHVNLSIITILLFCLRNG